MELAPNTLCLVVSGLSTGQTVTAIRPLSEPELRDLLPAELRWARLLGESDYWQVDPAVQWQVLVLGVPSNKIWVSAAKRSQLLPIPPLADDITTKQEEEKPCTA